jgi:phage anti-repressor protein
LNYHPTDDYPIDLDNIYSMIGFVNKGNARRTLENNFNLGIDYKIHVNEEVNSLLRRDKRDLEKQHGGQNKEKILLNVDTFKDLCMISRTEKGKEIRKYYLKLESISNSLVKDIIDDLNNKLIQTSKETAVKIRSKEDKIIDQFPEDKMCIYIADIGVIDGVHLVKFGESNNLKQRVGSHRTTFENFELVAAYEVFNSRKFEKMLKEVPEIKYRLKHTVVKDQNRNEIMFVDERYTLEDLNKEIKNMIEKHCTLESCLADVELRKSEIELRKSEIELQKQQEKTKQMELEIRILELNNKTVQEQLPQQPTPVTVNYTSEFEEWLNLNIKEDRASRLSLISIITEYDPEIVKNSKNYYKTCIEKYIQEKYQFVKPKCRSVKINGKDAYGWMSIGFAN